MGGVVQFSSDGESLIVAGRERTERWSVGSGTREWGFEPISGQSFGASEGHGGRGEADQGSAICCGDADDLRELGHVDR